MEVGKRCSRPKPAQCFSAKSLTCNYRRDETIKNEIIKEWLDLNSVHENVLDFLLYGEIEKKTEFASIWISALVSLGCRYRIFPIGTYYGRGSTQHTNGRAHCYFSNSLSYVVSTYSIIACLYVAMFNHGHHKRGDRVNQAKSQRIKQGIDNQNAQ